MASRQKYESLLPERYYKDDNRLSWILDEESDKNSVLASRSLPSDSSDCSLSLQRNVAAEPGLITPALSEMNNFVSARQRRCYLPYPSRSCTWCLQTASKAQSPLD